MKTETKREKSTKKRKAKKTIENSGNLTVVNPLPEGGFMNRSA